MSKECVLLREHWEEICSEVAKEKMSVAAYLYGAEPLFQEKDIIVLRCPSALHYDVLSIPSVKQCIERFLAKFSKTEHLSIKIIRHDKKRFILFSAKKLFDIDEYQS